MVRKLLTAKGQTVEAMSVDASAYAGLEHLFLPMPEWVLLVALLVSLQQNMSIEMLIRLGVMPDQLGSAPTMAAMPAPPAPAAPSGASPPS